MDVGGVVVLLEPQAQLPDVDANGTVFRWAVVPLFSKDRLADHLFGEAVTITEDGVASEVEKKLGQACGLLKWLTLCNPLGYLPARIL